MKRKKVRDLRTGQVIGPTEEKDCACGHVGEEHGHDPKYPGSTACNVEGCDCVAFDAGI